ncbi:MAG: hydrolase 1, exosortase A system-associated [Azonexus sp.]
MNYRETAVTFTCAGDELLGIVAVPETPGKTGIVIVVGGPQYRVGSHRQFALLSRALAAAGYFCLRFDHRGMGDSAGSSHGFEDINNEIATAIDTLMAQSPELKQVVLWGLCDAASAILMYCHATQDQRVAGLVLLNPWVRSENTLARTQIKHYYGERLISADFWLKLFKGQLEVGKALRGLQNNVKLAKSGEEVPPQGDSSFRQIMPQVLRKFNGKVLLILSGRDYTAKEFLDCATTETSWSGILERITIKRCDIAAADHTFSSAVWRQQVEQKTLEWLGELL